MNIKGVTKLSGLTPDQIHKLFSRYGFALHSQPRLGEAREFTPGDAFLICIAGALRAIGMKNEIVAQALTSTIPKIDPVTFHQLEVYPDRAALEATGEPVYAVVAKGRSGDQEIEFIQHSKLADYVRRIGQCVVLPASVMASTIDGFERPDAKL